MGKDSFQKSESLKQQRPPADPPSYEEVLNEETGSSSSARPASSVRPSTRPPARPPAAVEASQSSQKLSGNSVPPKHSQQSHNSSTDASDIYTANLDLPFRYPKGYFCKKCKNTGYKLKNGRVCKDCWKKFRPDIYYGPSYGSSPNSQYVPPQTPMASQIPFAAIPTSGPGPYVPPFPGMNSYNGTNNGYMGSPAAVPGMSPGPPPPNARVVKPGDPAIGGSLCYKCGGKGLVPFFLDEEICNACNGLGRIL
ncbi:hypothetical protein PACTADRAFT_50893 [Pachysolen tannophilus NRRL Y-2460]|uniref:Uncharacterized protein n=1 Tax=Pachysolen tannophilus NRRL Y-2460 TaxID=669874 RepID=A0A1E4TTM5_PACTA|nr:hypothetical protein PACTADRAFT_50893 [Pachysolen tannophilus NRRL Y-2460]